MAKLCSVCNSKTNFLNIIKIKDGVLCGSCINKTLGMSNINYFSSDEISQRITELENNNSLFNSFSPTGGIANYFEIDETNQRFRIGKNIETFPFSSLVNFELNQDGDAVTKGGLGGALVGGALLGTTGAVIGASTSKKTKTVINNMYIRISLDDKWVKDAKINIITTPTKTGGLTYQTYTTIADKIISALELIISKQSDVSAPISNTNVSVADEIAKFKKLLDDGIITADEFETKKKQLLSI